LKTFSRKPRFSSPDRDREMGMKKKNSKILFLRDSQNFKQPSWRSGEEPKICNRLIFDFSYILCGLIEAKQKWLWPTRLRFKYVLAVFGVALLWLCHQFQFVAHMNYNGVMSCMYVVGVCSALINGVSKTDLCFT